MIQRLVAALILLWAIGFVAFSLSLPKALDGHPTEGIVVLTGGQGRIQRGAALMSQHMALRMLISGVAADVKSRDIALTYDISLEEMACCIDIGRHATDTRSNAQETATWIEKRGFHSIRLVTNNWHMARARYEITRRIPRDVKIVSDAVEEQPSILLLLVEYDKYLWRRLSTPFDGLMS